MDSGYAPTGSSNNAPEVAEEPSLSWLTEQLEAGVADCLNAWADFKYGPQPTSGQAPGTPMDRLQRLADLVPELRRLATDIRSRA